MLINIYKYKHKLIVYYLSIDNLSQMNEELKQKLLKRREIADSSLIQ